MLPFLINLSIYLWSARICTVLSIQEHTASLNKFTLVGVLRADRIWGFRVYEHNTGTQRDYRIVAETRLLNPASTK